MEGKPWILKQAQRRYRVRAAGKPTLRHPAASARILVAWTVKRLLRKAQFAIAGAIKTTIGTSNREKKVTPKIGRIDRRAALQASGASIRSVRTDFYGTQTS